uniref:Membrane protein, putative n=1 Tax=Babesia bovis TaxID=5865 RepID=A7AQH8_BABBO|eukprot:XP_001610365.1 hypothetical protein [Babesia bovis T2Bo]
MLMKLLLALLPAILLLAPPAVPIVAPRRQSLSSSFGKFNTRLNSVQQPLCSVPSSRLRNETISVVVHSFWRQDSIFNTRIELVGNDTDTGLQIKRKIEAITGVPICLQKLYASDGPPPNDAMVPLEDSDRIGYFPSLIRLRHDTHGKEIHIQLKLPVPLLYRTTYDPGKYQEYLSAVQRYSTLLRKAKDSRSNPKLMLDPLSVMEENVMDNATADDSILGGTKLDSVTNIGYNDTIPADSYSYKSRFITPNRRIYLNFFEDLPEPMGSAKLLYWLNRQLPIDWNEHLKIAFFCYLIRETCDNEEWVKQLLLYSPPLFIISKFKPVRLALLTLFHMLPLNWLPRGKLYRVSP